MRENRLSGLGGRGRGDTRLVPTASYCIVTDEILHVFPHRTGVTLIVMLPEQLGDAAALRGRGDSFECQRLQGPPPGHRRAVAIAGAGRGQRDQSARRQLQEQRGRGYVHGAARRRAPLPPLGQMHGQLAPRPRRMLLAEPPNLVDVPVRQPPLRHSNLVHTGNLCRRYRREFSEKCPHADTRLKPGANEKGKKQRWYRAFVGGAGRCNDGCLSFDTPVSCGCLCGVNAALRPRAALSRGA